MKIQVNKKAINFKLQSTSGKVFNLSDVKNGIVIYFYPKDNTPGCTLETKDFSVLYKKFKALKYEVVGCLLYTSPSPRDLLKSRMPSSA